VIKVDQLDDKERLRSVVALLDREVDRLRQQVRDLSFELARLRGETAAQVEFGFPTAALERLLTAAPEPSRARPPRPAQPGHGPHPQAHLPVVEQRHELAPSDRACKICGGQLEPMAGQTEDAEEITVEERSYRLVIHRRQKYRCACNSNVATAPAPPKLIAGGRYSPEFAVHVAVQKYAEHLPLERQVEIMAHQGLETTSQTLWDQLVAAAAVLKPSYEALGKWLLGQPLLHVDETGWPVNALETRKPRWTAWCLCTATATWFRIASSKSEAEGRQLLGDYSGTVVADGYRVYKNLARGSPGYRLAHCWAHVLRKFRDTAESDSRSVWMLERIGELYKRERELTLAAGGKAVEHLALRQQELKPLLDEIHCWALAQGGLRRSDFGKALAYVLSHWQGLIQLLDDAAVPLDNNPAERALRGLVVGRKNHYGSRSERGAEVSALFYSLVGTARLRHLDPSTYLREAVHAALRQPGVVTLPL
jgi:transposase